MPVGQQEAASRTQHPNSCLIFHSPPISPPFYNKRKGGRLAFSPLLVCRSGPQLQPLRTLLVPMRWLIPRHLHWPAPRVLTECVIKLLPVRRALPVCMQPQLLIKGRPLPCLSLSPSPTTPNFRGWSLCPLPSPPQVNLPRKFCEWFNFPSCLRHHRPNNNMYYKDFFSTVKPTLLVLG